MFFVYNLLYISIEKYTAENGDIRSLFILFTYGDANLLIFVCNVAVLMSFLT